MGGHPVPLKKLLQTNSHDAAAQAVPTLCAPLLPNLPDLGQELKMTVFCKEMCWLLISDPLLPLPPFVGEGFIFPKIQEKNCSLKSPAASQ